MNTFEVVMLSSDTNAIPVKYAVVECAVGTSLSNTNLWLKCVAYGVATEADLKTIREQSNYYDKSLLLGVPGTYMVTTLNLVKPYNRKSDLTIPFVDVQIG